MGLISNGTTIFDAGSMAAGFGGSMSFIKKLTASSSGDLTFHNGASNVIFDSTYKEYLFTFNNMHPATDKVDFQFQVNAAGGADFNETITSTYFRAYHTEGDGTGFGYYGSGDLANGTGFQIIADGVGGAGDECADGIIHLYNPSSTTFVKHFTANFVNYRVNDNAYNVFTSGYANTTSAVDAVQFKFGANNIDAGTICLYGIA